MSTSNSTSANPVKIVPWLCGEPYKFPIDVPPPTPTVHVSQAADPWTTLLTRQRQLDSPRFEGYREEVQTLLTFAAIFSAVVTAFIVESMKSLRPDPPIALLLAVIQSGNSSDIKALLDPPTSSAAVRINAFYSLSLVVSLGTVGIGTCALQWIRELRRPMDELEPQIAFALQSMQNKALEAWYLPHFLTALPVLLQTALVLFLIGFADTVWDLDQTVRKLVCTAVGMIFTFLSITTVLPAFQDLSLILPRLKITDAAMEPRVPCPYKSPQSWAFHRVVSFLVCSIWAEHEDHNIQNFDIRSILSKTHRTGHYGRLSIPALLFRLKPGDRWLEHSIWWLYQRDEDLLQAASHKSYRQEKFEMRPVPIHDALEGLMNVQSQLSPEAFPAVSTVGACMEIMLAEDNIKTDLRFSDYLWRMTRSHSATTYGLPDGIDSPDADAVRDHILLQFYSRGDPDSVPLSSRQRVMEICVRLTRWLYDGEPRFWRASAQTDPLSLPIQWIAAQIDAESNSHHFVIQDQIFDILTHFFDNAARFTDRGYPKLYETMHTNKYVIKFICSAVQIITAAHGGRHNHQYGNLSQRLADILEDAVRSKTGKDYLFCTSYIFAYRLSERSDYRRSQPLRRLMVNIVAYRETMPPNVDLMKCVQMNHEHLPWTRFKSMVESMKS